LLNQVTRQAYHNYVPLLNDLIHFLQCFEEAVTASTDVVCPHYGELLTVSVDDPMGEESYQCCECGGTFDVDWGEGVVRFDLGE